MGVSEWTLGKKRRKEDTEKSGQDLRAALCWPLEKKVAKAPHQQVDDVCCNTKI